jgi:hypothetical protein
MNPTTKKILLFVGIGFLVAYVYKRSQESSDSGGQENVLPNGGDNDSNTILPVKKDNEFVAFGSECVLIGDIKDCFNHLKGYVAYPPSNTYDQQTLDAFKLIFNGTENLFDEKDGIRKSFLYDFSLVIANSANSDIPPCDCVYERITSLVVLGDKSTDVQKLQEIINDVYAPIDGMEHIEVNAIYTKVTLEQVQKLFNGVTAMADYSKGALSSEFINNFYKVLNNLKSNN